MEVHKLFSDNIEFPLEINNLWKSYDGTIALRGLDLRVRKGEVHGLLGPNGAGKTTTLKIIVGLLQKDKGIIKVMGRDIDEDPVEYKKYIGYLPEYPNLPLYLTVEEFISYVGKLRGMSRTKILERIEYYLDIFELQAKRKSIIADLSKGMKQKVAVIASMIAKPILLILDEPFLGIDPMGQKIVKDILVEWVNEGHSILISTHILDTAERMCDRVTIIHQGENLGTGTLEQLKTLAETGVNSSLEDVFLKLVSEIDNFNKLRENTKSSY